MGVSAFCVCMAAILLDRLREALRRSGQAPSVMARSAKLAPSTVTRILAGQTTTCHRDTIEALARALSVDAGFLTGELDPGQLSLWPALVRSVGTQPGAIVARQLTKAP